MKDVFSLFIFEVEIEFSLKIEDNLHTSTFPSFNLSMFTEEDGKALQLLMKTK